MLGQGLGVYETVKFWSGQLIKKINDFFIIL